MHAHLRVSLVACTRYRAHGKVKGESQSVGPGFLLCVRISNEQTQDKINTLFLKNVRSRESAMKEVGSEVLYFLGSLHHGEGLVSQMQT